jgi:glycosyltransferase involved in cell wall biosynthesis
MAAIARKFSRRKPKILFDIRGFFPEEYTDAGIWPENGVLYRSAKFIERWLFKQADGFVVLTERARQILFPESSETGSDKQGRPVEVIPCCVDLSRFNGVNGTTRSRIRETLGINGRYVMAYVGALGGWYMTNETVDFFGLLKEKRPDAFALILTQSKREMIEPLLQERGFSANDYLITKVPPRDIPEYLSAADASISFIKNCYSKQASSPTKNAEYLACGLPIIANAGIGDTDLQINGNRIGAIVNAFSDQDFAEAITAIENLGDVSDDCRKTASELFDLERVGGQRYRRIYERLTVR